MLSTDDEAYVPAVHALEPDTAATPSSALVSAPGLKPGWTFQACPFQCSISVKVVAEPVTEKPTAQAFLAETAATP